MICEARKTAKTLLCLSSLALLSACAAERHSSLNFAPAPPSAYASSIDNSISYKRVPTPVETVYAIPDEQTVDQYASLNAIEAAAGAAHAAGSGIAMPVVGPSVDVESAQVLAMSGCDYKDRFDDSDKMGYRWGGDSENRVGLNFGGNTNDDDARIQRGVKFGYSLKFDKPKNARNKGC